VPELPEVETVARQLDPDIRGLKLQVVTVRDHKLEGPDWEKGTGFTISKVRRVGKRVVLDLTKGKSQLWIAVHLRMTGRLIYVDPGSTKQIQTVRMGADRAVREATEKSLRLVFHLNKGELRFYDTRRFGTVELLDIEPQLTGDAIDPLARNFTAKALGALLEGVRTPVKPWMMRQDRIAGMGNIYASEALFAAGIDPRRPGGSLDEDEVKRLREAVADVMRRAVAKAGTTFSDYMDSRGKSGSFQQFLQVYKRAGQPCRKCGTEIRQITQAQRSTFYCPKCQR
jgi:formamidopyrimidine-DNA glycosylase